MPSQLSPICQPIDSAIKALENAKQSLSKDLQHAAPGEKPSITAEIKAMNGQIAKKQKELQDCIKKHPFVPKKPKKNPCLSLKEQADKLQAALDKLIHDSLAPLQQQLQTAAGSEKQALINEIKATKAEILSHSPLPKQIAAKRKEYNDCLIKNGGLLALDATCTGTATLQTSNSHAQGPFKKSVNIGLRFSEWDHRDVTITSFPPVSVTYDTHSPAGTVTTTVTLLGATGKYDPDNKSLSLDLSLFFHHSTSLAGDSRLDITLHSSSALSSEGKVTVDGSSKFRDGFLGNDICWLTVKGTISPHP